MLISSVVKTKYLVPLITLAALIVAPIRDAYSAQNQIPNLQRSIAAVLQNNRSPGAFNGIIAAYRRAVRLNPNQASALLRITNAQLNRIANPTQRTLIALNLTQATSAALIAAGITAESPLYLQTYPFIASTIPADQRTESVLSQIASSAATANQAAGGNPAQEVPVTDAILGTGGFTPPPVS
jgi:hypothetical protein